MTTTLAELPSRSTADEFVSAARTLLERAFGTAFEVVPAGCGTELQDSRKTTHDPIIEPLRDNRYRIVIPFSDDVGTTWSASGEVSTEDPKLLNSLVTTVVTAIDEIRRRRELSDQLEDFVRQMGDSLEEVAWLRRLATRLPTCDASRSLTEVCQAVLPPLRELIHADAIAVLALDRAGIDTSQTTSLWIGPAVIDLEVCRELAEQVASRPSEHAFVFGPLNCGTLPDDRSKVHTGIVARLASTDCHYGWLVAVNRTATGAPRPLARPDGVDSQPEFGTVEAGLLQATAVMLATHHHNAELFAEQKRLTIGVIRTLINAIDAKDRYTRGHSDRVARMAQRLAVEMGLSGPECERIYVTGLLHDVGKIGVPDHVLQKPGKLTPEEFDQIKQHPRIGYDIVRPLTQLSYTLPAVLHHHESMDGRGYPDGLRGSEIPLTARILAVADAYDAMTSCRPYRNAMSFERAEMILQDNAGTQWDPVVVAAFVATRSDMLAICRHGTTCSDPEPQPASPPWESNLWAEFTWRSDSLAAALVGSAS